MNIYVIILKLNMSNEFWKLCFIDNQIKYDFLVWILGFRAQLRQVRSDVDAEC